MKITQLHALRVRIPQKPPIAPYQIALPGRHRTRSAARPPGDRHRPRRLGRDAGRLDQQVLRGHARGPPAQPGRSAAIRSTSKRGTPRTRSAATWPAASRWPCGTSSARRRGSRSTSCSAARVRKKIELAACMGIRPYDEAKAIARQYVEQGFTTLKTKAGRDAAGRPGDGPRHPRRRRRPAEAAHRPEPWATPPRWPCPLARDLEKYNLEYFEQPMHVDAASASRPGCASGRRRRWRSTSR